MGVLTQYLVRYCIIEPLYHIEGIGLQMTNLEFAMFVISTVFIAAAGYLINDYYDLKIDPINKPNKVYVGKIISPSNAYTTFLVLNIIGCLLGIWVAWKIGFFNLGFLFIVCATVLYFYSLRYKRLLLWGNLSVSIILSFFPIVNVWLFEFFALYANPVAFGALFATSLIKYINWVVCAYALFAFLLTFIREIVKDIEDKEGDEEIGCKSFILVYRQKKTKLILFVLTLVTILLIAVAEIVLYNGQTMYFVFATVIMIQIPLIMFLVKLKSATSKEDYHILSNVLKFVMLVGILSMIGISQIV